MAISNAIGSEQVSKIIGYKLETSDNSETSANLPQRIAILAEANEDKQTGLDLTPKQITSAQQAGQIYGYGSPIHMIMRILRPVNGGGIVNGIPTFVYPQAKASGAASRAQTITVTGTATANGTHYVQVAGRNGLDGVFYAVNIVKNDTATVIAGKIRDAINNVLGCPISATAATSVATCTTKWAGLTSQAINLAMDTNNTTLGVTYAVAETVPGSGTPSIAAALSKFGSAWNTLVINSYGTETTTLAALEQFNGRPDTNTPTGRFTPAIMKPFLAVTGAIEQDPSSVTDSRKQEVTINIAPAPGSLGHPMEAAANSAALKARCYQDTPHLDISGQFYPDMPAPATIDDMSDYVKRDAIVKKGCSTVELVDNRYRVVDDVTTYHPDGETPPQFRYCRNLMAIDMNVRYTVLLKEQIHVVDHLLAGDNDPVNVEKVVKPKMWKKVMGSVADDLTQRGIITDAPFMQANTTVGLNNTNPDRLDTNFKYKRSGYARIISDTGSAGFSFGKN